MELYSAIPFSYGTLGFLTAVDLVNDVTFKFGHLQSIQSPRNQLLNTSPVSFLGHHSLQALSEADLHPNPLSRLVGKLLPEVEQRKKKIF